ncbi:TetR/AcrR family transcriptional regulator [Rhodovulum euryhalinum]|uniref:TetR family transcriptional regulator n=1 Tax=Rhodovulum euryhalinum TaxID=35805 RepID=A0A4R2KMT9_9RHOB|nr:TetR/AcrR family transcriptional regulator [Rhodovulum euryhalinum]TCO73972.1 TetR family transcriptional regulator [Rhodovulum euryhalinum]
MGNRTPRRGRPPQMQPAERERMILDAAERVLLARGLQGTTMAAVAREAGMSKRTLYAVFDGRAVLFPALVRRLREGIVAPLTPAQAARPLAERLRLLLAPDRLPAAGSVPLEVMRAAIAEAPRHPDLAESMLEEGPRAIRRLIRAELDRGVAAGEIGIDDTETAAALLHAMALPCPLDKLLDAGKAGEQPETSRARVDRAITVFLRGIAAAPPEAVRD